MLKNIPIIETLFILATSYLVLTFGGLTLNKWDSEQWWLMALSLFATLGTFILLTVMVKHLISHKNDEDD